MWQGWQLTKPSFPGKNGDGGLIGWDNRDFRDERDSDGREEMDKRERWMPVEKRPPFGRAARPFTDVEASGKAFGRARLRTRRLAPWKCAPPSGRAARPFAAVEASGKAF
ncbi:MAG: hypothetical protein J6866_01405, partial [Victivallales bacterium]|nr:hypothetical protein [Victivallales bacterium]